MVLVVFDGHSRVRQLTLSRDHGEAQVFQSYKYHPSHSVDDHLSVKIGLITRTR